MLSNITADTLDQLKLITDQLSKEEFTRKLDILNHSSIGQHVRHVLEFYICLSEGIKTNIVNYDKRCRNLSIENDPNYAIIVLGELVDLFSNHHSNQATVTNVTEFDGKEIAANSSVLRELIYLIEHSIHHYAIIAIALRNEFSHVQIPTNFGIAYSTAKHKSCVEAEFAHQHS
jgi:hypothetical protein